MIGNILGKKMKKFDEFRLYFAKILLSLGAIWRNN